VSFIGYKYPSVFESSYWTFANWFEREPGLVEDKIVEKPHKAFFADEKNKLLTYNNDRVRHCVTSFLSPDLSVCFSANIWFTHVAYVLYAILLAIYFVQQSFPDTKRGSKGAPIAACPATNASINQNMCSFDKMMDSAKGEFRFLIAFVLAGYVGASVARWKEIRGNYAALCGNCRNMLITINALIPFYPPGTKDVQQQQQPRQLCTRYTLLAFELAVLKSRGHMDSPQGRAFLESLELLQPGEWEAMIPGDRHTTVLFWIMHLMRKDHEKEAFCGPVCDATRQFREKANDMMSCLDRDFPYSYVSLCGLLVKLNVFIFSTWKAVEWAIWMKSAGYGGAFRQIRLYADILVLFVWNISYMALYDLGYYLGNPFGNRRIDVPHETISGGLHRLGRELSHESQQVLPQALMGRERVATQRSI
jgi:hypothetical protein